MCLPTGGGLGTNISRKDLKLGAALCRAYNNWARDFCSDSSGRVKFAAVVPGEDVEEQVIETRRAVEKLGALTIILPTASMEKEWHRPDYDPAVGDGDGPGPAPLHPRRPVAQRRPADQSPLPGQGIVVRGPVPRHGLPVREHGVLGPLHAQRHPGPLPRAEAVHPRVELRVAALLAQPAGEVLGGAAGGGLPTASP